MPVFQCDRCGVRYGMRAEQTHAAAHAYVDARAGGQAPAPLTKNVRKHVRWIAPQLPLPSVPRGRPKARPA